MTVIVTSRTTSGGMVPQHQTITVEGRYIEREKIQIDTGEGRATAVLDWLIYDLPEDDRDRRVVAVVAAEAVLSMSVVLDPDPEPAQSPVGVPPLGTTTSVSPGWTWPGGPPTTYTGGWNAGRPGNASSSPALPDEVVDGSLTPERTAAITAFGGPPLPVTNRGGYVPDPGDEPDQP